MTDMTDVLENEFKKNKKVKRFFDPLICHVVIISVMPMTEAKLTR